jgi:MoxR-like ATPase
MSNKQEPKYEYTGKYQPERETKDPNQRLYYPYLPSDDLIEAVNLAIALERPLLLEGEPGCGKTRLAGAVVYEFTKKYLQKEENQQEWWNYYIWNIKSTTRARDGLYSYDAVARLRDAQLMGTDPQRLQEFLGNVETRDLKERLQDKKNYREFGALGNFID